MKDISKAEHGGTTPHLLTVAGTTERFARLRRNSSMQTSNLMHLNGEETSSIRSHKDMNGNYMQKIKPLGQESYGLG